MYKVVQIWPGLFACKQVTVCPGHIWTTMYIKQAAWFLLDWVQYQTWLFYNNHYFCDDDCEEEEEEGQAQEDGEPLWHKPSAITNDCPSRV